MHLNIFNNKKKNFSLYYFILLKSIILITILTFFFLFNPLNSSLNNHWNNYLIKTGVFHLSYSHFIAAIIFILFIIVEIFLKWKTAIQKFINTSLNEIIIIAMLVGSFFYKEFWIWMIISLLFLEIYISFCKQILRTDQNSFLNKTKKYLWFLVLLISLIINKSTFQTTIYSWKTFIILIPYFVILFFLLYLFFKYSLDIINNFKTNSILKFKIKHNVANIITFLRIVLVVAIVILMSSYKNFLPPNNHFTWNSTIKSGNYILPYSYLISSILFSIAIFSDWLDGYIARKYNQVSNFGKFFDPIADKLIVNLIIVLFIYQVSLPVWIALILIIRDVYIDGFRLSLSKLNVVMQANKYGKWKTAFYMISLLIMFFLSNNSFTNSPFWYQKVILIPFYITCIASIFSAWIYTQSNIKKLIDKSF